MTAQTNTPRRLDVPICTTGLSTEQARHLRGATDVTRGILSVPAPVAFQSKSTLAVSVLDALGATGSLQLVGKVPDAATEVVLPWLLAYRVRHLMLTRADRMPASLLAWMLDLTAAAGATLWITGVPLPVPHWQVLEGRHLVKLTADEFCAAWDTTTRCTPRNPELNGDLVPLTRQWPPMPPDDFLTFRAAFHRSLASPAREEADALFLKTYSEARTWLRPLLCGADPRVRAEVQNRDGFLQLDRAALEEHISHYIHALLAECATTPELTVRVRAAQVAAFRLGWLLSVNLDRVVATADEPSDVARQDPRTWIALRLFRYPHQGTICVLAGLGLDSATIKALPGSAVTPDGATITAHGHDMAVPPAARVLLRAQHLLGQCEGRGADASFVFAPRAAITHERIRVTVRAALLDAGVPLLSRKVDSTWATNDWLDRWGVALQEVS